MSIVSGLSLRVREVEPLSPALKRFVFECAQGGRLPVAGAGAHLQFTLEGAARRWKNAYSIVSSPADGSRVEIIVRRVPQSRGGSVHLHEAVTPGAVVAASAPANLFPIALRARRHVMMSGGIGLTPFLAYTEALATMSSSWVLHHFCRDEEVPVFERLLAGLPAGRVHIHPESEGVDFTALLAMQPLGTHLYTCGPQGFMDAVLGAGRSLGWPASSLHSESFGGVATGGTPFLARLARSGIDVEVGPEQSLLEAIEAAGVDAPCLCRGGACGQCLTPVLEGEPEHRDHFLSPDERAGNRLIMPCVSRARSAHLVLDL